MRLQRPQRAAVEHRGLGELAVAEALVAGGAEPVHGVREFRAHPRAEPAHRGARPLPRQGVRNSVRAGAPTGEDWSPTANLPGRGRDARGGAGAARARGLLRMLGSGLT